MFEHIYGNALVKSLLESEITSGRLPHAFIIEGPSGSGKTYLARSVAAAMAKTEADVNKIMSSQSPDVMEIGLADKAKTIGIAAVRDIKERANLVPNDLDFKFFIIENAEALTTQAQNALLKIIEEPPRETYFMLLTKTVSSLLPTVRSRAVLLRMQVFSDDELRDFARGKKEFSDSAALERCIPFAGGSIGALAELMSSRKNNKNDETVRGILSAVSDRDKPRLLSFVNALPTDREAFEDALRELRRAVRDELALIYDENARTLLAGNSGVGGISPDRLYNIDGFLAELEKNLALNPNISAAKAYIFARLVQ